MHLVAFPHLSISTHFPKDPRLFFLFFSSFEMDPQKENEIERQFTLSEIENLMGEKLVYIKQHKKIVTMSNSTGKHR